MKDWINIEDQQPEMGQKIFAVFVSNSGDAMPDGGVYAGMSLHFHVLKNDGRKYIFHYWRPMEFEAQ